MPLVSPIIEKAAGYIPGSFYMRATDSNANIDIENIDIKDKVVILYNNLPTVKNNVEMGGINRQWPVEIKVLKLANADDNDVDGDVIRAELLPYCDLIFDACLKDNTVSQNEIPESYVLDFLNMVKIYDEMLTGISLKFDLFFDRKFFCVPSEPVPDP